MEGLMEHLTEVNEKRRAPEVGSMRMVIIKSRKQGMRG